MSRADSAEDHHEPLATWDTPLRPARFVARHKRYTVEAVADDGTTLRAHLGDPGRLIGLLEPGARLWLSGPYPTPPRKLAWSVRFVETHSALLGRTVTVGLDASLANRVVPRLLAVPEVLPELPGPRHLRREVRLASGQRIDLGWPGDTPDALHLCEIKTVGAVIEPGIAAWPDAPSERGRRHLAHLTEHVAAGHRATLLFVASREDVTAIRANAIIDPMFATALAAAADAGLELLGVRLRLSRRGVFFAGRVPVHAVVP